MDVRINPEVSTITLASMPVKEFAIFLGGVPRGAVAIIAGPDGLSDIESAETMNLLAQHGYESVLAQPPHDASGDLTSDAVVNYLVGRLAARGWADEQLGIIGYGHGARAGLLAGLHTTFGAVISIPREPRQLFTPDRLTGLRSPWLGLVGLGSHSGLTEELAFYRDEVKAASTEHTSLVGYPGVAHCLDDSTDALVHTAAFDSWQRTVEWLNIHVAPRPTPLAQAWQERQDSMQSTPN